MNKLILVLLFLTSCCCRQYVPQGKDYARKDRHPLATLNRAPTQHELDTYEIYKDDPQKLEEWLKDVQEREFKDQ